ncbi:TetR/AcrR family transcriptional regulator [Streptomyces sp. HPF1205]|uniref:TetR/AcrR family transcriptional regulator n=1 Tax=Streptomyces sp. HPF1205 TaxID=2873262 RepID=UPI001CED25B8|nr:TetR/AcrR family transcriptional regulator [Streptomyces sp. HPF1205]
MSEADEKPRRRQARGERRIAQLLQAAAQVFCKEGYTASSTSAIAREAGVSPGTLYQFFPNKEAIAIELSTQLIRDMERAHGRIFTEDNARLPLDRLIDAVTDPIIEFSTANLAMLALLKSPDAPGRVADDHQVLHTALVERVAGMIAVRAPSLSAGELALMAQMSLAMFTTGLDLVAEHGGEERAAYVRETKGVLYRYLAPYVGTEAVPRRSPASETETETGSESANGEGDGCADESAARVTGSEDEGAAATPEGRPTAP